MENAFHHLSVGGEKLVNIKYLCHYSPGNFYAFSLRTVKPIRKNSKTIFSSCKYGLMPHGDRTLSKPIADQEATEAN